MNLNPTEIQHLREFLECVTDNNSREPVSVLIKFQNRKFEENKGWATINIPLNEGRQAMSKLLDSIKQTCINNLKSINQNG